MHLRPLVRYLEPAAGKSIPSMAAPFPPPECLGQALNNVFSRHGSSAGDSSAHGTFCRRGGCICHASSPAVDWRSRAGSTLRPFWAPLPGWSELRFPHPASRMPKGVIVGGFGLALVPSIPWAPPQSPAQVSNSHTQSFPVGWESYGSQLA